MVTPARNMYTVYVEHVDNQPYGAEHRELAGEFPLYEMAVACAKRIVDQYIDEYMREHTFNPDELARAYAMHGTRPQIVLKKTKDIFDGNAYFRQRLQELAERKK